MRLAAGLAVMTVSPSVAQTCPSPLGWDEPLLARPAEVTGTHAALATGSSTLREPHGASGVNVVVISDRKPRPCTSASVVALDVSQSGKFDVVPSIATYIDLIRDGRTQKSTGRSSLQNRMGIRKLVTFDVVPSRYTVQLTDAPERTVKLATILR